MMCAVAVSAGALFLAFYPGMMSIDSFEQLRQARSGHFGDWHPPFMAWLWRGLDSILPGPTLMLVAQLILFLISLWSICRVAIVGSDMYRHAFIVLSIWLTPVSGIIGVIWKDVWTSCLLLFASACCVAIGTESGWKTRWRWLAAGIPALLVSMLFRTNAVFAAVPLLAYAMWNIARNLPPLRREAAALGLGAISSLLLLMLSIGINESLTDSRQYPSQSIQIFDIAGVSVLSENADCLEAVKESIPGLLRNQESVALADLQSAYYPSTWTPLVFEQASPFSVTDSEEQINQLYPIWWRCVSSEPGAYLVHRSHVFREVIGARPGPLFAPVYFGIPKASPDYQQVARLFPDIDLLEASPAQSMLRGAMEKSAEGPLYRPWLWLLLNIVIVTYACLRRSLLHIDLIAVGISGLAYELALFFIAPSADYRYSHWLVLSTWVMTFGLSVRLMQRRVERLTGKTQIRTH
jgi:hypothetical protein